MDAVQELTFSESIALRTLKQLGMKTAEEICESIGWEQEKAEKVLHQLVTKELAAIKHIKKHIVETLEDHTGLKHQVRDTKFVTAYQATPKAFKMP